ncbi:hypothetical protein ACRQ5D_04665 [Mucilaginibacter sp. P25]|uniref:hypothetical protein n=2 Tax=unclassified Mucilaginibacter TaxID=2617802 RepID=UPI003D7BDF52
MRHEFLIRVIFGDDRDPISGGKPPLDLKIINHLKFNVMKTQVVSKFTDKVPALFEDIFKPWTELFDGGFLRKELHVPAVNIIDHKGQYVLSMSAPGLKKRILRSMWMATF